MNNIIRTVLLIVSVTTFLIPKIHAQTKPSANDQHKKDTAMLNNRTPRRNTDQPPVTETNKNKAPGVKDNKSQSPANDQQKANSPAVNERTPRTYNDQPPIKEVPKNYPPANSKQKLHQRQVRQRKKTDSSRLHTGPNKS